MKPLILAFLLLFVTFSFAAGIESSTITLPGIDRQGGPDGYGYRYVDNRNEPTGPLFDWYEISGSAGGPGVNTNLTLDDETVAIPLQGFSFDYYGTTYTDSITVCSNGFIGFGLRSTFFENTQLPYSVHTLPCIYPMWDDLSLPDGGSIWYYYDAANRRFIVEWYQIPNAAAPLSRHTFQVRLYQTGVVEFLYQTIGALANSCTIGIQGPNGGSSNRWLQYTRNGNPVEPIDSLAIRFALSLAQLTVRVTNADSTATIPNAQVYLYGAWSYSATADTSGYAVFTNMKTGNYRIRAIANGFQSLTTAQFAIANSDTINRTLALTTQAVIPNAPSELSATGGQNGQVPLVWRRPATASDEQRLVTERVSLVDALASIPANEVERRIRFEQRLAIVEHDLARIEYERTQSSTDALFGYNIYRITGMDTALVGYRNLPTDTTFTDVGLTNGVYYRYFVRAVYDEGLSTLSNVTGAYPRPFGVYLVEQDLYQWVDIANRGTAAVFGDDEISPLIALPFRFPFYGEMWDSLQISTNGFIARSLTVDDADLRYSTGIPDPARPNNLIAGYWTDLVAPRDSVRYWYDTTNTRFVVSVLSSQFYGAPSTTVSFQYLLYRNGNIFVNIRRATPPQFSSEQTFGVENRWGTEGNGVFEQGILLPVTNRTLRVYRDSSFCNIVGTVTDSITGLPLSATVRLEYSAIGIHQIEQTTNPSNGGFEFLNVFVTPNVFYELEVSAPGYEIQPHFFTVFPDCVITLNARLHPTGNLPPSQVQSNGSFDDRIRLTWQPPQAGASDETDELTGYRVYRDAALQATLPSTATTYDDSLGSNGENVAHTYRVSATYTTAPTEVFATDLVGVRYNMPPASPVNLMTTTSGDSIIQLGWAPPTSNRDGTTLIDGTSFRIYRNNSLLTSIPFSQTSYTDRNVDTLNTYVYTVTACDEVNPPNESEPSNPAFAAFRNPYRSVPYYWLNIPGATTVPLAIDQAQKVTLGFQFNYFGTVFDSVTISSNGFLSFTDEQWWPRDCPGFPNATAPNAVIAPLWGELDCSQGTVSFTTINRVFIASFENILFQTTRDTAGSFQVRIDSTGAITFAYRTPPRIAQYGIGIEDASGMTGYQLNRNGVGVFTPIAQSSIAFFSSVVGTGMLSGTVVRPNNTPLSNVQISVNDTWSAVSNAAGQYSLVLPVGEWRVRVSRPCFYPDSIIHNPVTIILSQTTTLRDTLGQGDLATNPAGIETSADRGQVVNRPVDLQNNGDGRLTWQADIVYRTPLDEILTSQIVNPTIPPVTDQIWGPDGFGYRAYDITEPEVPGLQFWPDITGTGTVVVAGDDQGVMCEMDGFVFNYYGVNFTRLFVSTNGIVKFTEVTTGTGYNTNTTLPNFTAFNALMPLWDDLEATVYKQYNPANNTFILQWDGNRYPNVADTVQFQIVFYGNERMIVFGYNRIHSQAISATVGIQNNTGSNNRYLSLYYGSQPGQGIPTNMNRWGVVFFAPNQPGPGNWLSIPAPGTHAINPGQTQTISLRIEIDSSYSVGNQLLADIRFTSSACDTVVFPVSVTVSNDVRDGVTAGVPQAFQLHQNYPNPFNPTTEIRFDTPSASRVRLQVFNVLGREIATLVEGKLEAGFHSVRFDASSLPAGVYFYRIETDSRQAIRKMILMK